MHYIANLIFGEILDVSFQVIPERPHLKATDTVLQYGGASGATIPACGLLEDSFGIRKIITPDENGINGDLLAGAFWWATGYVYQCEPQYDQHGRYDFASYPHIQQHLHNKPWVHIYAHKIAELLQLPLPKRIEKKPQISFDIDHPWLFNQKPIGVTAGSLLKKISKADLQAVQNQLRSLFTQKDPAHTFDTIFELTNPKQSTFFFLIERRHAYDTRHTWRNKAYRSLIQDIHRRGYTIGIHPSYLTYLSPDHIKEETERLAQIIGEPVTHSRMHFLKYRQPATFRALIAAGIRHDYTVGFYHDTGFAYGLARSFYWFDLEKNERTILRLHPTHMMDRTFLSYLNVAPEEAEKRAQALHKTISKIDGEMLMLFHNESLSDFGEWKEWAKAIKAMLMIT